MKRTLIAVCCALLVVLAGCSGGGPTTEAPDASTPGDETTTDGPAPTVTGSPLSLSVGDTVAPATLASAHAVRLDGQSYTLRDTVGRNTQITRVDDTGLARADRASGTYFLTGDVAFHNESEGETRRYVARPPTRTVSTGAERIRSLRPDLIVMDTVTVGSETRYVLTPGIDYQNHTSRVAFRRLVVGERGLVYNYTSGTYDPDRGVDRGQTLALSDVGATSVETPDWVDRLRDAPVDASADRGTVVVENSAVDASIRVTGAVSSLSDVDLRENTNDFLSGGFVAEASVSPLVDVVVGDPSANATVTVGYDESRLAAGDTERNISLFVYNETLQTYVQMNTTIDTTENTATATRAHEITYSTGGGPERTIRPTLTGERPAVVAMHAPTYYEAWRNAG